MIHDMIFEIIEFYDTNVFDLNIFAEEYNDLINSWIVFENTFKSNLGKQLNYETQMQLGINLQTVKEMNQILLNKVREKY